MILAYRNFVSLTLCHDMHSNSKGNTANKGLVGLASVKKKKKIRIFGDLGIQQYICPDVKS